MEGNFGRGKCWRIWRMTINSPNFPQPNFMLQIDLVYNTDFEMECPQLDERLQSLAVVAHSLLLFVHVKRGVPNSGVFKCLHV